MTTANALVGMQARRAKKTLIAGAFAVAAMFLAVDASASTGVSYTHYRFKVDAVYGSTANAMQIGELALLCDGENVTRKHFSSVERGLLVPKSVADDVSQRGDGNWQTGTGESDPSQAIDGTMDKKFYDTNGSPTRSNAEYRDKCYVQINCANTVRVTAYIWSTADTAFSLDASCRSPKDFRLQGSNDGVTWTDIDVQTDFTPPTTKCTWTKPIPVGGASDMGGYATDAKWFRWTILRRQGDNKSSMGVPVSEFALYDAGGNRVNTGMAPVAKDTAPTALNPGETTWSGDMSVGGNMFDYLMDGDLATRFQCTGILDSARNVKVVLRLSDAAAPVAGYNLATGANAASYPERNPVRWTLEASYDGETWFTVDDRRDVAAPPGNSQWYNAGVPYAFRGPAKNGNVVTVGAFDADSVPGNPVPGRGTTVKKVGAGSLDYTGGVPSGVEVEGGTLTICPTFSKYRFKTDALAPAATSSYGVQMAELMLFDDWTNVTYGGTASKATGPVNPDNGNVWAGNAASLGIDGLWDAGKCYYDCNISPTRSYDPNWDMCYLQIDYPSPRRVSSYAWATAHDSYDSTQNNCRNPYDFRLQGSNDGETWTDLDVRTGFMAPNASNTMTRAFSCPAAPGVVRGTDAKYFRLTIKSKKDNSESAKGVQFSEFGLFNADGKRVNTNMIAQTHRKAATALVAGEATASAPKNVNMNTGEGLDKLFDGDCMTKFYYNNTGNLFDINDSANWLVITMRLADDAPEVFGYGFATANDFANRDPDAWLIEASEDGTTWTKLDERSGHYMTATRRVWDTYNLPFAELANAREWCVSNVCVAAGATLNVGDDRVRIGGLTIDCDTGGGTISRLNAADAGTINLLSATRPSFAQYSLPLTIGSIANGANLRNWTVMVNGVRRENVRAMAENGEVVLRGAGLVIILR